MGINLVTIPNIIVIIRVAVNFRALVHATTDLGRYGYQ